MYKDRKRNRLKEFDYTQGYWYFVTICVKDMKMFLGKVSNEKIILNNFGKIVEEKWLDLKIKHPWLYLDEYVVMPNHFHGIITFEAVGTTHELSLQGKIKSLSYYLGKFKMQSSKAIHLAGLKEFKWQRSFYDRIIRNETELYNIRRYIRLNPLKWELERNYPKNLDF